MDLAKSFFIDKQIISHKVYLMFLGWFCSFVFKKLDFYPTLLKSDHCINTHCYMNNSYMLVFVNCVIVFTGMQDYKDCTLAYNLSWGELIQS